jgi:hypothetical protein
MTPSAVTNTNPGICKSASRATEAALYESIRRGDGSRTQCLRGPKLPPGSTPRLIGPSVGRGICVNPVRRVVRSQTSVSNSKAADDWLPGRRCGGDQFPGGA